MLNNFINKVTKNTGMIQWQYFPKSNDASPFMKGIVDCFRSIAVKIDSRKFGLRSNVVVDIVRPCLEDIGFKVETGKKRHEKIVVPVLFGLNGKLEKSFEADAYHANEKTVLEIEAGRAYTNYQFLKDLFEACMMYHVEYLVIAVRNIYLKSKDFNKVITFFETLYASKRLSLPLKGILIIGY